MKKKISILVFLMVFIVSCRATSSNKVDLTKKADEPPMNYTEVDNIENEPEIKQINLEIPEGAELSAFCVDKGKIYYAIDFMEYLTPKEEGEKKPKFEEKYNTCVMSYDIDKNKTTEVYRYSTDRCVDVIDIKASKNRLLWEELGGEYGWQIKYKVLDRTAEPETIVKKSLKEEGFRIISLALDDNAVYWNDVSKTDKKRVSNYSYDFNTKKITVESPKINLSSPYEPINIVNGFFCLTEKKDDVSIIHVYNKKNSKSTEISVKGEAVLPVTNGKICAWRRANNGNVIDNIVYIYDLEKNIVDKISLPKVFSYAPCGDYLLVNQRSSDKSDICLYDVKSKKFYKIMSSGTYLYTLSNSDGEVYFEEVVDGVSKIICIK